jgi:hypothetical protein
MLLLREVVKTLLFYYYGGEFEVPLFVVGTVRGNEWQHDSTADLMPTPLSISR